MEDAAVQAAQALPAWAQALLAVASAWLAKYGAQAGYRKLRPEAEAPAAVPHADCVTHPQLAEALTAVRHEAVAAAREVGARIDGALDKQHAKITRLYEDGQRTDARMARAEESMRTATASVERLEERSHVEAEERGEVRAQLRSLDASLAEVLRLLRERSPRDRERSE